MVSVVARGTRKLERQFHETLGNLKSDLPSRIPEFMRDDLRDLREGSERRYCGFQPFWTTVLKLDVKTENTKSTKYQVRAILLSKEAFICPLHSKISVFAYECYSVLI